MVQVRRDPRGNLAVFEGAGLPFELRRTFVIWGVPTGASRGGHAHRECHQFLVPLTGSVVATTSDGTSRVEYFLDTPEHGLHLTPMTWLELSGFTPDTVLLVACSHPYDESEYIRDHGSFLFESNGSDS